MANRKPKITPEKPPLSQMARHMLNYYGIVRLPMMRAEYEAGLPLDMAMSQRYARIAAINEIIAPKNPQ